MSYSTGILAEERAMEYFQNLGYQLVKKNYRVPGGEIDLILQKKNFLIFVEVKMRQNEHFGTPEESMTPRKKKHLAWAIHQYLQHKYTSHKIPHPSWRCDLITLTPHTLKHYLDIFAE